MVLDKCELSPELLLNVSLQFFYFSILLPGHLLLTELMCFFMPSPPVLQEHHFIQSDGGCSHGGSQDFCEDILPLLHGDHQASLSPLCPTGILVSLSFYGLHHNPNVWPNPEASWWCEEGMGCSLCTSRSCSCSVDWCEEFDPTVLAPLFSLQVFDPTRFSPGSTRHSYAFLPFSGGSRWGLCTGGSRCHWLLPDMCDCIHSYVVHAVLSLCADVVRRRHGSPCTRRSLGPATMTLTSWCPRGLTSFPCQWLIQSIQGFPHFRSMTS